MFTVTVTDCKQYNYVPILTFCAKLVAVTQLAYTIMFLSYLSEDQPVLRDTGFHTGEGGAKLQNSPPPQPQFPPFPEILKLSMVINILSQVLNNNLVPVCVRSNLRGSKFKFSWGSMPPDPPSRHTHTYTCVSMLSHATIILLPPCSPPPQLKMLYETLRYT